MSEEVMTDGPMEFDFSEALYALKDGHKIMRSGWNGRGMYVELVFGTESLNSHFEIYNTSKTKDTWVPSVSDLLAHDWQFYK